MPQWQVLGIFPKAFSQVTISPMGTSQMCNFPSGNFPKVTLGLLKLQWGVECCGQDRASGPSAAARKGQWAERGGSNETVRRALWLGWHRGQSAAARAYGGPSAVERTDLASFCLGNFTFGKLPLGKMPLGIPLKVWYDKE